MTKEIKRNTWSKFFKKFSDNNRFRKINVSVKQNDNYEDWKTFEVPFMGMMLEKKGRLIDGLQLFSGWWDGDQVARPLYSFKSPDKIILEKNENGDDWRLMLWTSDGVEASIELMGVKNPDWVVEKVAYSLYERRGYTHGQDANDWFEAERRVHEAEETLV